MNYEDLSGWLVSRYALPCPCTCSLLRSYTNDVYEVRSNGQRFVLKVYGASWRTQSEIEYEVSLLQHLRARGVRTAAPIAGRRGYVEPISFACAARYAVLFEYAPGEKPQPPLKAELYVAFGRAVAQFHACSIDFANEHQRTDLDLGQLIEVPLAQVLPLLANPADHRFLSNIAARLYENVAGFASTGLEWGSIHGDATLDNLHVTDQGDVILIDFDSGGPGWRASDLQGWAANNYTYRDRWHAFQKGYSSVRQMEQVNWVAAPYLTVAWDIWGLKVDLDNRIGQQGPSRVREYLSDRIAEIRIRCNQCRLCD